MAKEEHLRIIRQGVAVWNKFRDERHDIRPDLTSANLSGENLNYANLRFTDLMNVNLSGAQLMSVDFSYSNLNNADLSNAALNLAIFSHTKLDGANFSRAFLSETIFANINLTLVKGFEEVIHSGPSTIGIDTIYRSGGNIKGDFLIGAGIPDSFTTHMHSLVGAVQAIQFYSCFISYSTKDEEFARRLYSRMRDEHLRVWFAPEDIKGGQKLYEQVERAIQLHDRLLLVLSDNSMQSEWVITEIRNARRVEAEEKRRKLFPIRLVDFEIIRNWKCFDAETGKDLAVEIREYFIPDFSNWKKHDAFEAAFKRLLGDLKAEETK